MKKNRLKSIKLEGFFWAAALVLLAVSDPHDHYFTLCPLANLGITGCPCCGLGRSVSALFHGQILESFRYHRFGIPALALIVYRLCLLTLLNKKIYLNHKRGN